MNIVIVQRISNGVYMYCSLPFHIYTRHWRPYSNLTMLTPMKFDLWWVVGRHIKKSKSKWWALILIRSFGNNILKFLTTTMWFSLCMRVMYIFSLYWKVFLGISIKLITRHLSIWLLLTLTTTKKHSECIKCYLHSLSSGFLFPSWIIWNP